MHALTVLFLLQVAVWSRVAAQATDSGPCFDPGAACYVFGVELKACNYDYSCLCGTGTQECFCGALHQFGPACVACRTSNGTYDTLAAEINDALTDCIGVNGTNAVGSGSTVSSTTTSSSLETSVATSLTTVVSSYTTTNAEGVTQTVVSSVTSATVAQVTGPATNNTTSSTHSPGQTVSTGVIIGVVVGGVVVLVLGILIGWMGCRRRTRRPSSLSQAPYNQAPYPDGPIGGAGFDGYGAAPAIDKGINSEMTEEELSGARLGPL